MSDICKNWTQWLKASRFAYMDEAQREQTVQWLLSVRDIVLKNLDAKAGQTIIDIGTGTGLLAFGALEKFGDNVRIIFSDKFQDCLDECKALLDKMDVPNSAEFLLSPCENINLANNSVDRVMMRSVLVHILDKQRAFNEIFRILKPGGILSAFEPIIRSNTRYYELVNESQVSDYTEFKRAEAEFMSSPDDPLTNFDENSIVQNLEQAGVENAEIDARITPSRYVVQQNAVEAWFTTPPSPGSKTVKERFLKYFDEKKVDKFILEVKNALEGQTVEITAKTLFIKAWKPL